MFKRKPKVDDGNTTAAEGAADQAEEEKKPQTPREHLLAVWRGWVRPILTVIIVLSVIRSSLVDWNDVPSGSMLPTIQIGDRIVVNKVAYGLHFPFTGPKFGIPFTGVEFSNPLRGIPSWQYGMPERGDIITFWSPAKDESPVGVKGTRLVKRCVAIAGDTIQFTVDGKLIITTPDGTRMEATYSNERYAGIRQGKNIYGKLDRTEVFSFTENVDGDERTVLLAENLAMSQSRPAPGREGVYQPDSANLLKSGDSYTIPEGHIWAMGDNRDQSGDSRSFGPVPMEYVTGRVFGVAFSLNESWVPQVSRTFKGLDGPVNDN